MEANYTLNYPKEHILVIKKNNNQTAFNLSTCDKERKLQQSAYFVPNAFWLIVSCMAQ